MLLFVKIRVDLFAVVFDFDVVSVLRQVSRILFRRFDFVWVFVYKAECFLVLFASCAAILFAHISHNRLADVVLLKRLREH